MNPYKEDRPWGNFIEYTKNEPTTVKIITVNPNQSLSLQRHAKRKEFWRIIKGDGIVTIGEKEEAANAGDEFMVEVGDLHRVEAGDEGLQFLEISFGEFDENDIERLEDEYGRV